MTRLNYKRLETITITETPSPIIPQLLAQFRAKFRYKGQSEWTRHTTCIYTCTMPYSWHTRITSCIVHVIFMQQKCYLLWQMYTDQEVIFEPDITSGPGMCTAATSWYQQRSQLVTLYLKHVHLILLYVLRSIEHQHMPQARRATQSVFHLGIYYVVKTYSAHHNSYLLLQIQS